MSGEFEAQAPPTDELLARLHERVEERRRNGEYPPELELDLNEHYHRIVNSHPAGASMLARRLEEVERSSEITRDRIVLSSRLPGGSLAHRMVDRAVSRQTDSLLAQMRWFAGSVREALTVIADTLWELQPQQRQTALVDLSARVDMVLERLAEFERAPSSEDPGTRALATRVHRLESEVRIARFPPTYSRARLLELVDGQPTAAREALAPVAELLAAHSPVLLLDVGRGELLDLLPPAVETHAVDSDEGLATAAGRPGRAVTLGEPLAFLDSLAEESVGGVYLGALPERVVHGALFDLVASAVRVLVPGGLLVARCHQPRVLSQEPERWFQDPLRLRPVPPSLLEFVCREAGFSSTDQLPSGENITYSLVATR